MSKERKANNRDEGDVWKGIAAGLIGGLAASWVMNQFQAAWSNAAERFEQPHSARSKRPSEGQNSGQTSEENEENQDDATGRATTALMERLDQ